MCVYVFLTPVHPSFVTRFLPVLRPGRELNTGLAIGGGKKALDLLVICHRTQCLLGHRLIEVKRVGIDG